MGGLMKPKTVRRCHLYAAGVSALAMASAPAAMAAPTLAPIWGDHMVVQQGHTIIVEGQADPGESVQLTLGEEQKAGQADQQGHFAVRFAPRKASAEALNLTLSSSAGAVQNIKDILVGDVWLCSGQSNMELTQAQALNAWNEQQAAHDPKLRMVNIPHAVALTPQKHFGGPVQWQTTTPETVGQFSAVCYYMAKHLRAKLGIPIGAVHASWGGSEIRPWLSPTGGAAIYGQPAMDMLAQYEAAPDTSLKAFAPVWQRWYQENSAGEQPWDAPDNVQWLKVPQAGAWNYWQGTQLAKKPSATVWFRRTINLTKAQAKGTAQLSLGVLDDIDMTWVNGHPVGNTYGPTDERHYTVPASALHSGANEIIVAITNLWGDGGMMSDDSLLTLTPAGSTPIALGGQWLYSPAPIEQMPPRTPWDSFAGIGVMHNGMIAPIGDFAMKGAAWYQGESDVGKPGYDKRLKALFAGWRAQFGSDMRMLVVQIANYGEPQITPQNSSSAQLREEERIGVQQDSNAALVTALDIGERTDIHPANKEVLGLRLASAAVGDDLPHPQFAKREGDQIIVNFSGVKGTLKSWGGPAVLSVELCGDTDNSCRFADASANGSTIRIADDGAPATRVRYGWADSPTLNLYDDRPFPPPGFQLPITDGR